MFHRQRWINWIASFVFIIAAASCDGLGAGCGCAMQPLPAGGLPSDQTIEGGAQIRVTPSGLDKITALVPALLNESLAGGVCIPPASAVGIDICSSNDGICTPGCQADLTIDSVTASIPSSHILRLDVQFDGHSDVYVDAGWVGSCTLGVTMTNSHMIADVAVGTDADTGELTLALDDLNSDLNLDLEGCGILDTLLEGTISLFEGLLVDLFRGTIEDMLLGLLPDPLGVEGRLAMGGLLGDISGSTDASIEMRGVPGGFVELVGNGMTLGVIMGVNSDRDVSTRTPDMDSEPAQCVPRLAAPDFAAPPASLPTSPRGAFTLIAAEEFRGAPDPAADVAIGVSETALDLTGHHAVTSGALCLGVGTVQIPQLNLGTIALFTPSLAELGSDSGKDPLLMVTRPIQPIDFSIGDGTEASPALTVNLNEFEIDFYAFLFERYVRAFTVRVDMSLGVNLEFTTTDAGQPALLPVLTGLDTENIRITALNTEFLRETDEDLEATLPSVLDLALPLLSGALEPFELPEVAGFTLGNLRVGKVVTSEDEFLAIFASLTESTALRELAATYPPLRDALGEAEPAPAPARTRATLAAVHTPPIENIRAALRGQPDGLLPEVVIDVEPYDELGRRLEWTWNIDGGMWRPFTDAAPLVIRDTALAWQGRHDIQVRARVAGDYRTLDAEGVTLPVVLDSVGPFIHKDRAALEQNQLKVPATDLVSPEDAIEFAYGRPGDSAPATAWTRGGLTLREASSLAADSSTIAVYARDERGNTSAALVDIGAVLGYHGSEPAGCSCAAAGADARSLGGLGLIAGLSMLLLAAMRRRRQPSPATRRGRQGTRGGSRRLLGLLFYAGLVVAAGALPACDCGGGGVVPCEEAVQCDEYCGAGELGVCLDGVCACQDDVPYGNIGQYSDMAVSPGGEVWVSAYNATHGDLNVASWPSTGAIDSGTWQFVDGVPDGPVTVERSTIRGGITAAGEDVGKYTSIAANDRGDVMVSYFDEDQASLKFAAYVDGAWQIHTVQAGTPPSGADVPFEVAGQYSSLTLSDDGRPGIAYFAHVSEDGGVSRTEVRFASAQTTTPERTSDWITYVIEEAVLPADASEPDPLDIPPGVGLFVSSARQSDQTPVVVYYDRINTALKMSRFDLEAGTFLPPVVLDGEDGSDVGWYPSVAVDPADYVHVSYVSASTDDLLYINTLDNVPELVDDGYREVGTTDDGLPKPELHLVGDDSSIVITSEGPMIAYQDATTHELLLAYKDGGGAGAWTFRTVAGNESEFRGAFGFYTAAAFVGQEVVMSTWVLDPPSGTAWVEIFREPVTQ